MPGADTAPVRPGEELDLARLSAYLGEPVELEQFPGGHSNLTYLLKTPKQEYVLRRAPLGPVPPKAHDMAREFRVLQAVAPVFPPAPRVYQLCDDPAVIGTPFFLMERRRGIILRTTVPADVEAVPGWREQVSNAYLDCLITLHEVDVSAEPLRSLGRPEGFVERQVRGWAERWQRAKTSESAAMDRAIAWLAKHIPTAGAPALVHNDFKLDNLMLRAGRLDQVEALLDWEMTTVGEPLADLGLALTYWAHADVPGMRRLTSGPGWIKRDEIAHQYALRTGRDLRFLAYYETLGVFKLAVILQQIYYRFHAGQTRDERFRRFDEAVAQLIETATRLMERAR